MRRCSVRLVHRQSEAPVEGQTISWYGSFWRWFQALWAANRRGAEFLYEDFCGRVEALRLNDGPPIVADWYAEVASCESQHAEALHAAILNTDVQAIKRKLAQAIAAKRRLMALLEAREQSVKRAA